MATYNYDEYVEKKKETEKPRVGYFSSLKDDGDEAYVRFDYDSKQDFSVVTVHKIKVGDRYREVECLKKDLKSPVSTCPFCENKQQMSVRVYVRLIEYVKDDKGNVTVQPSIWARSKSFVGDLMEALKDAVSDGDIAPDAKIRDLVFRIRRKGAKGDLKTSYGIKVAKQAIYPESTYVKDFSAFKDFTPAHHSYMVRTAEEMRNFIATGKFKPDTEEAPAKVEEKKVAPAQVAPAPKVEPVRPAPVAAKIVNPADLQDESAVEKHEETNPVTHTGPKRYAI